MNIPNFENLLENKNYENILTYFPDNISSNLVRTITIFSKNFPLGETTKELTSNFTAKELELIYERFVKREWTNNDLISFKNILLDLKKVDQALVPIKDILGMTYTLSLTGGALRDIITGKANEISDLDIVVNISGPEDLSFDLTVEDARNNINILDKFNKIYAVISPKMHKLGLNDFVAKTSKGGYGEQLCYYLVSSLINNNINVKKLYPPRDIELVSEDNSDISTFDASTYNSLYLQAVLKLEDKRLNYPVDILLSNVTVDTYNRAFDFNLCKVYFDYHTLNDNLKKTINKDMPLNEVIKYFDNITYNHDFIEDVIYKKMTFTFTDFILSQVECSLNKHYPKLQSKYEDYNFYLEQGAFKYCKNIEDYNKLNLSLSSLKKEDLNSKIKDEVKDFLVSTVRYNALDRKVPNKDTRSEKLLRPRKI